MKSAFVTFNTAKHSSILCNNQYLYVPVKKQEDKGFFRFIEKQFIDKHQALSIGNYIDREIGERYCFAFKEPYNSNSYIIYNAPPPSYKSVMREEDIKDYVNDISREIGVKSVVWHIAYWPFYFINKKPETSLKPISSIKLSPIIMNKTLYKNFIILDEYSGNYEYEVFLQPNSNREAVLGSWDKGWETIDDNLKFKIIAFSDEKDLRGGMYFYKIEDSSLDMWDVLAYFSDPANISKETGLSNNNLIFSTYGSGYFESYFKDKEVRDFLEDIL